MARDDTALLSRRGLVVGAGGALTTLACAESAQPQPNPPASATTPPATASEPDPTSRARASLELLAIARDELARGQLDVEAWRVTVEAALSGLELDAFRETLAIDAEFPASVPARGYFSGRLEHPLGLKLFGLARGRAILPHAHRHIVSLFLVLHGRVHARHYDRVRDEARAIVIRPSDARELGPGACVTIGETRDNVHWFTGLGEAALLLNLSLTLPPVLRRERGPSGRVYLDPAGESLGEGLIRAPRSSLTELRARYERPSRGPSGPYSK